MEEHQDFKIPVYVAFTKEILVAGVPADMAIVLLAGMVFALGIFRNMPVFLFMLVIYIALWLTIKFSPKFDTKILKILGRMKLKKYINP